MASDGRSSSASKDPEANCRLAWVKGGFEKQDVGVVSSRKDVCGKLSGGGGDGTEFGQQLDGGAAAPCRTGSVAGR